MGAPATKERGPRQLGFESRTWGGKRKGAGRKPRVPGRAGTPHRTRPPLASRYPVHVTFSVDESLPSLRSDALYPQIEGCFREAKDREGFRLVHYSVQRRHLHLIVEALDAAALSRGLQALSIRIAKRINRTLGRRGRVFVDRYFGRILRTPRQTRAAVAYVINNVRRHGPRRPNVRVKRGWIDDRSSGPWFDGWRDHRADPPTDRGSPVSAPRTWLLQAGWRKHGLIAIDEIPGPPGSGATTRSVRTRSR